MRLRDRTVVGEHTVEAHDLDRAHFNTLTETDVVTLYLGPLIARCQVTIHCTGIVDLRVFDDPILLQVFIELREGKLLRDQRHADVR